MRGGGKLVKVIILLIVISGCMVTNVCDMVKCERYVEVFLLGME